MASFWHLGTARPYVRATPTWTELKERWRELSAQKLKELRERKRKGELLPKKPEPPKA